MIGDGIYISGGVILIIVIVILLILFLRGRVLMAAKKEPFGGKQAKPFGKGKAEQEKAKPSKASKGRERQDTGKDKK